MTTIGAALEKRTARLTLSEIVRKQLAGRPDLSSVKLTRNARGETQIEVKIGTGEEGIETADDAARKACEVYDLLTERYHHTGRVPPPAWVHGGNDASE